MNAQEIDELKELLATRGRAEFGLQNYAVEYDEQEVRVQLWINPLTHKVYDEENGRQTNLRLDMSFGEKSNMGPEVTYLTCKQFFEDELKFAEEFDGIEGIRLEKRNARE